MLESVLFDLDGTLLDREKSLEKFIELQYQNLVAHQYNTDFNQYKNRFIELDNNGYTWKDTVYESLIEEFGLKRLTTESLLQDYIHNFSKCIVPMDNLYQTLDFLSEKNIKLGIITNGKTDFQRKNIKALKIEKYFKVILISEEEKLKKPQAEIFLKALKLLEVSANETIFVGDHLTNDVLGANNVGMLGILFDNKCKSINMKNRIKDLKEIADYIITD